MARFRQPGPAAIAFMNTLAATEARFSVRARSARRPCRAKAMPRQAKTRAAAAGRWRAVSAIRYWAVKLTAAAAAASTQRPAAALRSHRPDRSEAGREAGGVPVPRVVARDGPVRARGTTGARAKAPVVRCGPG